jgi:hypothetical protein
MLLWQTSIPSWISFLFLLRSMELEFLWPMLSSCYRLNDGTIYTPFNDETVSRRPKTATLDAVLRVSLTGDGLGIRLA